MSDLHGHDREGYSEDVKDRLLEMIASGDHGGVKTICRTYPDEMPKANTVWCWLNPHHKLYDEVFRDGYLAAKEVTAHNLADAIIEDFNKLGNEGMDYRFANVRLSQVQWIAKSLAPKSYGDRKSLDHTSSDGSMTPKAAAELTDDELAKIAANIPL